MNAITSLDALAPAAPWAAWVAIRHLSEAEIQAGCWRRDGLEVCDRARVLEERQRLAVADAAAARADRATWHARMAEAARMRHGAMKLRIYARQLFTAAELRDAGMGLDEATDTAGLHNPLGRFYSALRHDQLPPLAMLLAYLPEGWRP